MCWSDPSYLITSSCLQHIAPIWAVPYCTPANACAWLGMHILRWIKKCLRTLHEHVHMHFQYFSLQLDRCRSTHTHAWTHTSTFFCVTWARSSCSVSFESALRGLTWAATCLSRARSDQTEQRLPLQHSCSPLSPFPPLPPHICTVLLRGRTHGNTHTFTSPRQTTFTSRKILRLSESNTSHT